MPRKLPVTDAQLIESLQNLYGPEITSGDLRGFCAYRNLNYQTISNKLAQYKTDRGRWNLEVTQERVEEIERSYSAPAVLFRVMVKRSVWSKRVLNLSVN